MNTQAYRVHNTYAHWQDESDMYVRVDLSTFIRGSAKMSTRSTPSRNINSLLNMLCKMTVELTFEKYLLYFFSKVSSISISRITSSSELTFWKILSRSDFEKHRSCTFINEILLQHTATHCNTLQHTATHCNTLQHTATHWNTLQHTATHYDTLSHNTVSVCNVLQHRLQCAT